eukprot:1179064-Rhodomonas_salina.1
MKRSVEKMDDEKQTAEHNIKKAHDKYDKDELPKQMAQNKIIVEEQKVLRTAPLVHTATLTSGGAGAEGEAGEADRRVRSAHPAGDEGCLLYTSPSPRDRG